MSLTKPDELIYDRERDLGWVHPDLDLEYIEGAGADIASILLDDGACAEIAYQPGDGTFYGLVFVPLRSLVPARPRVKDGRVWEQRAARGMFDDAVGHKQYNQQGYLVAWVENAVYPIHLGDRGVIAANYVAEHWNTSPCSAHSLALLFRTVSHFLSA